MSKKPIRVTVKADSAAFEAAALAKLYYRIRHRHTGFETSIPAAEWVAHDDSYQSEWKVLRHPHMSEDEVRELAKAHVSVVVDPEGAAAGAEAAGDALSSKGE